MKGEVFRKELELDAGCDCFNSLGRNSEVQAMSAAGEAARVSQTRIFIEDI